MYIEEARKLWKMNYTSSSEIISETTEYIMVIVYSYLKRENYSFEIS